MVSIFVDAERVGPQLQQTTLSIRTWANFREEEKNMTAFSFISNSKKTFHEIYLH